MGQENLKFQKDYTKEVKSSSSRQSRKFKDIDLNFTRHPVSNDIGTLEDAIAIKRSVRNLIQTNYYERPFHPELGLSLIHISEPTRRRGIWFAVLCVE